MNGLFAIIIVIIVIAAAVKIFSEFKIGPEEGRNSKHSSFEYSYKKKNYFMTLTENRCYQALVDAVGNDYYIFAQVHLPTIVDEKVKGQTWKAARAHVDRKSVDFVLCDKENISPKLAIELDGRTHERPDRVERDGEVERILRGADLPLLRIENHGHFDSAELAQKIKEKLV